jgi:hypothetical protein
MNGEKLFGGPARSASGSTDNDGLKLVLHRYIIDAIEESGKRASTIGEDSSRRRPSGARMRCITRST